VRSQESGENDEASCRGTVTFPGVGHDLTQNKDVALF
jgi:hypothetical protein